MANKSFLVSLVLAFLMAAQVVQAGSATWNLNPATGDWNTPTNWTPATVPNGSSDVATFGASSVSSVVVTSNVEVAAINFSPGAPSFGLTADPLVTLTISGSGIANNANPVESFVSAVDSLSNVGAIVFTNSAEAGTLTSFTNAGNPTDKFDFGGATRFLAKSTADHAVFVNMGSTAVGGFGGITYFGDQAQAGLQ